MSFHQGVFHLVQKKIKDLFDFLGSEAVIINVWPKPNNQTLSSFKALGYIVSYIENQSILKSVEQNGTGELFIQEEIAGLVYHEEGTAIPLVRQGAIILRESIYQITEIEQISLENNITILKIKAIR